jgi:hypothetical protein
MSDPLVLPSSLGPPIDLRNPSPFEPVLSGKPLPPAARLVVDAFVAQHGLHPPAALKASLASYLNVGAQKIKNHFAGRRRAETARQAALAAEAERAREAQAREAALEHERRAREQADQRAARLQALAEWERSDAPRRHKRGLDYYWSKGEIWVEGRDIGDVPIKQPLRLQEDDAPSAGPDEYALVDALFRHVFGQPKKFSAELVGNAYAAGPALPCSSASPAAPQSSDSAYTLLHRLSSPALCGSVAHSSCVSLDSPANSSDVGLYQSLGTAATSVASVDRRSSSVNTARPRIALPVRRAPSGSKLARRRSSLSLAAIWRTRSAPGAAQRSLSAAERKKVARCQCEVGRRRLSGSV